jgi:hypothetical protein
MKSKEIDKNFFKQRLTNLVIDLSNFEEAPWSRVHKSKKKMLKQEYPENYDWHGYNTLKESKNYKNRLEKQISILPRSPQIISIVQ